MLRKIIQPVGWPCTLAECPPGPFVTMANPGLLCFKSEYHHGGGRVIALNSAGEYFSDDNQCKVQPVEMTEVDEDVS